MRYDPDEKTILKIKLTREYREFWVLLKILAIVCSFIASIGMMQYYFCNAAHPRWTVLECLRP